MDDLFGFLSVDELVGAIAAWREMEKRASLAQDTRSNLPFLSHRTLEWILEPVDALDHVAGMRALGFCENCGADLANPDNCGDGKNHTEKDYIVELRRELKTVWAIYFRAMGEPK